MNPKQALGLLVGALWRQDKISPVTEEVYLLKMRDIHPALLEATINRIIDQSKSFPSISEIRETAAKIAGILPPSAEEAMAIVRQADVEESVYRRDGSFAYTERFWRWPDDMPASWIGYISAVLERAGDPIGKDGEKIFAWDTEFKRIYFGMSENVKQNILADLSKAALPEPRKQIAGPSKASPWPEEEVDIEKARKIIAAISENLGA